MQHFGVDFNETISLVTRYTTIRLFLALCALLSLNINQMDVDYAFVNADLEDDVDICCHPLSGMNIPSGKYIRLNKALYGIRQAARQWNMDINILAMGYSCLVSDSCMYVRSNYDEETLVIIVLYLDDMNIAFQHQKILNRVKNGFMNK